MNPHELVGHIRSGLALELDLREPLPRFRRRTRSSPCDFNEFIQALQHSETIQDIRCGSHRESGISEDEWILLVKTLGRIRDIHNLWLCCRAGSRDFRPFQAVAEALNGAQSLRELVIGLRCESLGGEHFPSDSSGLIVLANALREHASLHEFTWFDCGSRREVAPWDFSLDLVLQALPTCPHLELVYIMTKCASADAVKNLIQWRTAAKLHLTLTPDHWLAVADGIRQSHCKIKRLYLSLIRTSSSQASEAVKAIASAIRLDRSLESLDLRMMNEFTDEAGMTLAEALTVNNTLRLITLTVRPNGQVQDASVLSASVNEAFSAMLHVNTSLVVKLPPFKDTIGDERLVDSRNQMRIEQGLNEVGRGRLLSSSQTPRKEWVYALNKLSSRDDASPEFNVSCLYSLLRLNPSVCLLELNDTTGTNSGL
jgi:hypothetical protein